MKHRIIAFHCADRRLPVYFSAAFTGIVVPVSVQTVNPAKLVFCKDVAVFNKGCSQSRFCPTAQAACPVYHTVSVVYHSFVRLQSQSVQPAHNLCNRFSEKVYAWSQHEKRNNRALTYRPYMAYRKYCRQV